MPKAKKTKQYTYVEYAAIEVVINVPEGTEDVDIDSIGSEYVDKLLYDTKTLRKRAAEIDTPEVWYKGADFTGESEIYENGK